MGECALLFNVTESWLSTVRNSEMFVAYRAGRMKEHHQNLSKSVIELAEDVAKEALSTLHERIRTNRQAIELEIVKDTAEMALKALGFGVRTGPANAPVIGQQTNNTFQISVAPEALSRAREHMRRLTPEAAEVLEAHPLPLAAGSPIENHHEKLLSASR